MESNVFEQHFSRVNLCGKRFLNLDSFYNEYKSSNIKFSRVLMIPFYVAYYLMFCTPVKIPKPPAFLQNIENGLNYGKVDFFLFQSKGKSPFMFYANIFLIKAFHKISGILLYDSPKIYDVDSIVKFNCYANLVLFSLLIFLVGYYLRLKSNKSYVILGAQYLIFYLSNTIFIKESQDGLLNIDLLFNILTVSCFIHLEKYNSNKVKDLINLSITGLILGMLYSLKPMSLISKVFPGYIILTWVWKVITVYQFDKERSRSRIVGYQTLFKPLVLVSTMMIFSFKILNVFLNQAVYDENNFDLRQLSPMSQISLNSIKNLDNHLIGVPKDIRYMDTVLIRHVDSLGGYLHSHDANLQTGSGKQQVTVFDHQDQMNEWIILPSDNDLRSSYVSKNNTDYDVVSKFKPILLQHKITGKFLHVHNDFRGPVSEKEKAHEVSCVEFDPLSDESHNNFEFRIEYPGNNVESNLQVVNSEFELVSSVASGCKLLSHIDRLPPWGYFQQEVICMEMAVPKKTKFVVEKIVASTPESIEKLEYKFLDNLSLMEIMKDYQTKSLKKEKYDDDFQSKVDSHKNQGNVISNKEAIFHKSQLKYLHTAFIVVAAINTCWIVKLAFWILPFEEGDRNMYLIYALRTSAFRQLCDFVQFFIGIVVYSFLLIKTKETVIIDDLSFQPAVILEILIIFEYINSLIY
ncbi:uncharacterized protein HGUI_00434 [Hanseniaspora guilliermondii]|uniref:MIR domain-containing protein n=1 Tax=Hanseniaspora guilliermondii TaxID=56406 RepID=A0A1L0AUJ2_9ASCO|nr:uncharacterized protein HGUI_00434 [Hanseniaspora guilliermondii]